MPGISSKLLVNEQSKPNRDEVRATLQARAPALLALMDEMRARFGAKCIGIEFADGLEPRTIGKPELGAQWWAEGVVPFFHQRPEEWREERRAERKAIGSRGGARRGAARGGRAGVARGAPVP